MYVFKKKSFELSIRQRILKKMHHIFHKNIKQHNHFQYDKKCFLSSKSVIRMISEGSCDTADWSNDADNSDLTSEVLLKLHFKTDIFNFNDIS